MRTSSPIGKIDDDDDSGQYNIFPYFFGFMFKTTLESWSQEDF